MYLLGRTIYKKALHNRQYRDTYTKIDYTVERKAYGSQEMFVSAEQFTSCKTVFV